MDYKSWLFQKVTDYFDNRFQNNIYQFSGELAQYPPEQRKNIYAAISEHIIAYMERCIKNNEILQTIACCVVDDMYRSINSERYFSSEIMEYLDATGRIFLEYLSRKNVSIHYLCNNTFTNSDAIVWLFPAFLNSCGIQYYSPHYIAWLLMERDGIPYRKFEMEYPRYQKEALCVMHKAIVESNERGDHYLVLFPDADRDDFFPATEAIGKTGVLTIVRTEPPLDSAKFGAYFYQ